MFIKNGQILNFLISGKLVYTISLMSPIIRFGAYPSSYILTYTPFY